MSFRSRSTRARAQGFSLLEILVAFAIMAIALGMLYRVMGNNARHTGQLAGQERAIVLAQSLLAAYQVVPPDGVQATGDTAGYAWALQSTPYATPANNEPRAAKLHELRITIQWADGNNQRSYALASLRPERRPLAGAGL